MLAAAKQSKPKVIGKAAELRLIGKAVTAAEELGLLGIADSVSLSQIEKAGLLSKGEALIYDRGAPGPILALGFALAAAGSAAVYAIPDDSAALIAARRAFAAQSTATPACFVAPPGAATTSLGCRSSMRLARTPSAASTAVPL